MWDWIKWWANFSDVIALLDSRQRDLHGTLMNWRELTWIGFDTETTGKYPIGSEICEIGAVKWRDGQVVEEFQELVRPRAKMSDEVIAIHGITNEMVQDAPAIGDVLPRFYRFIQDGILVAHHAQFDMGFLAYEFERFCLSLPTPPVICTSLLSRKLIREASNHRLQTLVQLLGLTGGTAHRAKDDAYACLQVALECFKRLGELAGLDDILRAMVRELLWSRFSIDELMENQNVLSLVRAIEHRQPVEMVYRGGSRPGRERRVVPEGIVRNLDGDYLVAREPGATVTKRYLIDKVDSVVKTI